MCEKRSANNNCTSTAVARGRTTCMPGVGVAVFKPPQKTPPEPPLVLFYFPAMLHGLFYLQKFQLNKNPLPKILHGAFAWSANLKYLELSDLPNLKSIDECSFFGAGRLLNVKIDRNPKLERTSPNAFHNSPGIVELHVRNCPRFKRLETDTFRCEAKRPLTPQGHANYYGFYVPQGWVAGMRRLKLAHFSGNAEERCGIEEIEIGTFGGESDFLEATELTFSYCALRKIAKNTFGTCCTVGTQACWDSGKQYWTDQTKWQFDLQRDSHTINKANKAGKSKLLWSARARLVNASTSNACCANVSSRCRGTCRRCVLERIRRHQKRAAP